MKKIIQQWELPNGSQVKIGNKFITFIKMDGMYAQWDDNGKFSIGNYYGFTKSGKSHHYIPVDKPKDYNNPKRWDTNKIVNKVEGIKEKLKTVTKHSKEWYILQLKREVAGSKKHIVNFEKLLDKYEKEK